MIPRSLLRGSSSAEISAEQSKEAHGIYRPRLDLEAGYTAQQAPQQVVIGGLSEATQDQNYAHFGLAAEQLLYDFSRSAGKVAAADASARKARFAYAGREQDLFLQTGVAYFQVLIAEQLLQAAAEEVTQTEAHLRVAKALFEQQMVTRNDVLQAEVRLASARQQQLARSGALENAWLQLNYLTGRPTAARAELHPETDLALPSVPDAAAIASRPEIAAQQQQVTAAQAGVQQAQGAFRPELFAHLGADYVENSHVKEQTIYSATLGLRVNLADGGASSARLRAARQRLDQERRVLADLEQQALLDYRSARNDAAVAAQRIAVMEAAIRQAQENLRLNQNRYREQVGTATEVLDAQTLLTQSRTDLYRAQFEYQLALARVQRAIGAL
ncbi:TolC family protein [Desulfuromonas sp. DDH964]|uniref:TolC family protein n=1 Tax=Desulfuromonas sp. DDH964 TaxID=1823759 RepID=UPI0009EEA7CC|nr:TolC family protein [Desulfuromonas sp. DDH964]